jgi:Uma2 family endonuclease
MRSMSLRIRQDDILDAMEHLPNGATLVIHDFDWVGYEHLLDAMGDRAHFRVSFDHGRLEVLSRGTPHEEYARLMDLIVFAFCESCNLNVRCFGQATWKKQSVSTGLEPDACYYVKSAELIRGGNNITLESDPPPDIAVEIDLTRSSLRKLSIYGALKIPEVWRYDGNAVHIYALTENKYSDISESNLLPGLTSRMLAEVLEACKTGQTIDVIKAFRLRIDESKR